MQITLDLVRRANESMIHHKRYSKEIEDRAAKLPTLTAEQINKAWATVKAKERMQNSGMYGRETFKEGTILKHFKRDLTEGASDRYLYTYLGQVKHADTQEVLVLYKALYGSMDSYVRPIGEFYSPVDKEKYPNAKQKWRFEKF